jgi:hypothetical protein
VFPGACIRLISEFAAEKIKMLRLMQNHPLLISALIDHAADADG